MLVRICKSFFIEIVLLLFCKVEKVFVFVNGLEDGEIVLKCFFDEKFFFCKVIGDIVFIIFGGGVCKFFWSFFKSDDGSSFCESVKGGVWVLIEGGGDKVLKILVEGVWVFLCCW